MNRTIFLTLLLCIAYSVHAAVETNPKGKWGYVDDNGNLIIDYKYDFIGDFSENGLALVKKGKNFGMVNRSGEEVLPAVYSQIVPFDQTKLILLQKGKIGFASLKGEVLHAPEYLHILPFNSDGIAIAVLNKNGGKDMLNANNLVALVHENGKELARGTAGTLAQLTTKDDKVTTLSALYVDTIDTRCGYFYNKSIAVIYDIQGNIVMNDAIRTKIYQAFAGPSASLANRHPSLTNTESIPHCDVTSFKYTTFVDNNTANITVGYFNLKTQKVLYHFTARCTRRYNKQKGVYVFSPTGADISCRHFNDGVGIARVTNNGSGSGDFVIDTEGNVVGKFLTKQCYDSQHGYMVAGRGGRYGLFDTQNKVFSISPQFKNVKTSITKYSNWAVKNDSSQWGVLNTNGDSIVPFNYDEIMQYTNGNFIGVKQNGKWGVYAHNKQVIECACDSLCGATPNSVMFNKWGWRYNEYSYGTYYEKHVDVTYGIYWLHADSISYFDGFEAIYPADSIYHNSYIWLMHKSNAKGWPVYGAVNNFGEEVIPFIFENKELAVQAICHYRYKPLRHFSKADGRRLLLFFTRRNNKHSLYDDIPVTSWDY